MECSKRYPTCAHAVSLLIDIWEEEGTAESLQLAVQVCDMFSPWDDVSTESCSSAPAGMQGCEELAAHLAQTYKKYWLYRKDLFVARLQNAI